MNRTVFLVALSAAAGFAAGAAVEHALSAPKSAVSRVELVTADLAGVPGKEVRMYTTELAPGAITPRHRHPGQYFVYVLDGTGSLEQEGGTERALGPGSAYFLDDAALGDESWHTVWNTDSARPLKSLAILITDKGKPGTVFAR